MQDSCKFIHLECDNFISSYSVNYEKILKKIRFRHLSKIIERMYSANAGRVIRLLKQYKVLDEENLSYLSVSSIKDVRTILHVLIKDGFLEY